VTGVAYFLIKTITDGLTYYDDTKNTTMWYVIYFTLSLLLPLLPPVLCCRLLFSLVALALCEVLSVYIVFLVFSCV
jgi:hypothetical protein